MTTNNEIKKQKSRRMTELLDICRQRYLEAGGDSHKSVNCNQWMSSSEKQEFFELSQQVFTNEDITNYQKKHGTWRKKFAALKNQMHSM